MPLTLSFGILEKIYEIDHAILLYIQENIRVDVLNPIMQGISLSVNLGLLWVLIGLLLLCFKKTRLIGAVVLSSLLVGLCINNVLIKHLVARARPYDTYSDLFPIIAKPSDTSFASGHTTASFAAAGVLVRFLNKPLCTVVVGYAVLVGFSRLYVGVHYPTDVLCGCIIGLLGSLLVYHIYSKKFDLKEYRLVKHSDENIQKNSAEPN